MRDEEGSRTVIGQDFMITGKQNAFLFVYLRMKNIPDE